MNLVKSMQASLIQKHFKYNDKYFSAFSVYWGFELTTGKPVLEQDYWGVIANYLGNEAPIDEGMVKDQPEFLVFGKAIAPENKAVQSLLVNAEFAEVSKTLQVTGNRNWQGSEQNPNQENTVANPAPFTEMLIDYSLAFGGEEFEQNPNGKGFKTDALPNIEYSDNRITSPNDLIAPASFSTINCDWQSRKQWAGTYDESYIDNDMPGLARDVDWRYFNNAASDQWLKSPLTGDESFSFTHFNVTHSVLTGQLPSIRARCFIEQELPDDLQPNLDYGATKLAEFKEIPLSLDTVYFFPNENLGVVVHRGTSEINHPFAQDIKKVLLAHENLQDSKRELDYYRTEMVKRTDPDHSWKYLLDSRPLIPVGCPCAFSSQLQQSIDDSENLLGDNLKTFAEFKQQDADAKIEQQMDKVYQQLAEKAPDQAQAIKAQIEQVQDKPLDEITDPDIKKIIELQQQIVPDPDKLKNELDLAQINLAAMDDLSEQMAALADKHNAQNISLLEEQLAKLKQNQHLKEAPELIVQIEVMLREMTLPPVLPRIDELNLSEIETTQQVGIDKQLAKLRDPEILKHLNAEQIEKLKGLEAQLAQLNTTDNQVVELAENSYLANAHFIDDARSPHEGEEAQRAETLIAEVNNALTISNRDIAFAQLYKASLAGANLAKGLFEYCGLNQCDFSQANLNQANFAHAKLVACHFNQIQAEQVNLGAALIEQCEFSQVNFSEATFAKSTLTSVTFTECQFGDRLDMWLETTFEHCHFVNCQFNDYNFVDLTMLGCTFENCQFENTHFINGEQTACRFINCQIKAVNFVQSKLDNASFANSTLTNVRFVAGVSLNHADFTNATVVESNLRDTQLHHANFTGATLDKTDFGNAQASHANFNQAQGIMSQFMDSNLQYCNFNSANMMEASFMQADLRCCNFTGANLYGVTFLNATFGANQFHFANLTKTILQDWQP